MNVRKKRGGGLTFLFIFLLCAGIAAFLLLREPPSGNTNLAEPLPDKNQWPAESVALSDVEDSKLLWLVNAEYPIPDESSLLPAISAYKTIPLSRANIDLNATALSQMDLWLDAAADAGFPNLLVTSGYRTWADQERIYAEAEDKSYVQIPGGSEHQTGLAADLLKEGMALRDMTGSPEGLWLNETARLYGFILRYPADKERVTGISYESWHFRYVGLPHAYYISEHNLCLEEYLDFLKNGPGYQMTIEGVTYGVYYAVAADGALALPRGKERTVSSDNRGGYVVTFVI